MTDLLAQIWERATTTQAAPSVAIIAVLGIVALLAVGAPQGYRLIRHGVTVLHEAGHAVVALLVGRRLSGIRLHSDTSGVTVSRGRAAGPGMIATLAAGYPAPALIALAGTVVLNAGYAVGLLWALVALTAVMVLFVRNLYGLGVLVTIGVSVALVSWTLPAVAASAIAYALVWMLLLAAPRSVFELSASRRRAARFGGDTTSDAAQLARLARLPAPLWTAFFAALTLIAAVVGAALLLGI
ncbi:MAG: M50 family metallopeptidase [Ornithinimicrobium sp.]